MNIILEPLLGEPGAWNAGKPVRGARLIVVDGKTYGSVQMKGHGCHGVSYEFYDSIGAGLPRRFNDGKESRYNLESIAGLSKRDWKNKGDNRESDERIIAKAAELIAAGRLRDPDVVKAEGEKELAEWQTRRAAENARKEDMRAALKSIAARETLTNSERAGLADAYNEIFGEAMI